MAKVLWTQKQDVGPSARGEHAIAYDATRQRIVLFGGRVAGGTPRGDTWEWDGADWTQVADTGPDARSGHALAFDANRQRAVLFGGEAAEPALRADTWEWDGGDWTQVADTGPDARSGHALAFDANRQRTVLFGGEAAEPALRADTWEWDGADWTQVADTGPDARSGHALAFDANRQRAVLFGGRAGGGTLRGDTWEWDGADWTQVADTGPSPSFALTLTFGAGATLLFGGFTSSPAPVAADALSRLSWEWDGGHWTLRQDMGPAPRWGHALAFDSARGRAVLFGGFSVLPADPGVADSVLADTWETSLEKVALVSFGAETWRHTSGHIYSAADNTPVTVSVSNVGPNTETFRVQIRDVSPGRGEQVIYNDGPSSVNPRKLGISQFLCSTANDCFGIITVDVITSSRFLVPVLSYMQTSPVGKTAEQIRGGDWTVFGPEQGDRELGSQILRVTSPAWTRS